MKTLREVLLNLRKNHFLIGIKGGTEVEGMTFEEIYFMKEVSNNIVPMTVKIGGPEARNDIDFMLSIGIERILAPMIESPYSLKNFVETIEKLDSNQSTSLAINIETITAYNNLDAIIRCPKFLSIDQITVGRSDLSGSMEKDVDDQEVCVIVKEIVDQSKFYNKLTSIGGKINPNNAINVKNLINPDYINTRHMLIDCHSLNISEDVRAALLWEKMFYQYLMKNFPSREHFYIERIESVENRLCYQSKRLSDIPKSFYNS